MYIPAYQNFTDNLSTTSCCNLVPADSVQYLGTDHVLGPMDNYVPIIVASQRTQWVWFQGPPGAISFHGFRSPRWLVICYGESTTTP